MSAKTTRDADGHPTRTHRGRHGLPSHHVGPCSAACRAGRVTHAHRVAKDRLYRSGAKGAQLRRFKRRYGAKKGAYVYGAVVGKVRRERAAMRR